eukprot:scaffold62501_cov16-Tisochrysis_lutea.AAC.1
MQACEQVVEDASTRTGSQSAASSQPALAAASAAVLLAMGAVLAGNASAQVLTEAIWGSEGLLEGEEGAADFAELDRMFGQEPEGFHSGRERSRHGHYCRSRIFRKFINYMASKHCHSNTKKICIDYPSSCGQQASLRRLEKSVTQLIHKHKDQRVMLPHTAPLA